MTKTSVIDVMTQIRDLLMQQAEIWTIDTFCTCTGYEKSYVYKMTSQKKIPHYKTPGGKTIFFKRSDVMEFLTKNRIKSKDELDKEANDILKIKDVVPKRK